jgi:hypothetical protein
MNLETAIRRMIDFHQIKDENATIWTSIDEDKDQAIYSRNACIHPTT